MQASKSGAAHRKFYIQYAPKMTWLPCCLLQVRWANSFLSLLFYIIHATNKEKKRVFFFLALLLHGATPMTNRTSFHNIFNLYFSYVSMRKQRDTMLLRNWKCTNFCEWGLAMATTMCCTCKPWLQTSHAHKWKRRKRRRWHINWHREFIWKRCLLHTHMFLLRNARRSFPFRLGSVPSSKKP
jgi:hypothetical protein